VDLGFKGRQHATGVVPALFAVEDAAAAPLDQKVLPAAPGSASPPCTTWPAAAARTPSQLLTPALHVPFHPGAGCSRVRNGTSPEVTGEDGRVVLEILMAAYASAGSGQKVPLPFTTDAKKPIDLWLRRKQ
jgi:hypothetical protein